MSCLEQNSLGYTVVYFQACAFFTTLSPQNLFNPTGLYAIIALL